MDIKTLAGLALICGSLLGTGCADPKGTVVVSCSLPAVEIPIWVIASDTRLPASYRLIIDQKEVKNTCQREGWVSDYFGLSYAYKFFDEPGSRGILADQEVDLQIRECDTVGKVYPEILSARVTPTEQDRQFSIPQCFKPDIEHTQTVIELIL